MVFTADDKQLIKSLRLLFVVCSKHHLETVTVATRS